MPKVVIFTEGSSTIGFGHITRCLSLAQALTLKGIEVLFVLGGDEWALKLVEEVGFKGIPVGDLNKVKDFPEGEGAFVDSYLAGEEFYKKLSQRYKVKVYLDDYFRLDYPDGYILNYIPALEVPPKYKNKPLLWGEKYHLLRKPFWDVPKKETRQKVEEILITFGGDDLRNMSLKVAKTVLENIEGIRLNIVVGGGFKNKHLLEELPKQNPERVRLFYNLTAEGMRDLMLRSDLAVSAGGQTLFELARVGLPVVPIGVAENQLNNLEGFKKLGFLKDYLWWEDKNLEEKLLTEIEKLLPQKERVKISNLGREIIDGKGALRVAEFFEKHL